eukprot:gene14522-17166_t
MPVPIYISEEDTQKSTFRWVVNISQWKPCEDEWKFLLSLLPDEESDAVKRFKFQDDQKRAIVSRLLQRRCIEMALDIPYENICIKRTKGRKPFLANKGNTPAAPNFNYNVSHEGDYVVLVSEPVCVCGVDVAAPQAGRRGKKMTFEETFK